MGKITNRLKNLVSSFHCEACGKKCNNREQAKYNLYLEKWYDLDAKSATEVKLCLECAAPVVAVVKKAKAFQAMKRKDIELDPHANKKPYEF